MISQQHRNDLIHLFNATSVYLQRYIRLSLIKKINKKVSHDQTEVCNSMNNTKQ